jgi:mono/diheme cytochrome c family protein
VQRAFSPGKSRLRALRLRQRRKCYQVQIGSGITLMTHLRLITLPLIAALLSFFVASSRVTPVAAKISTPVAVPLFLRVASMSRNSAFALQAASSDDKSKSSDPLPDGKGKDVTKRACSACHSVNVFAQQRHTGDQWDAILDSMVSKGLSASDDDLDTIHNYLVTYLGPAKPDVPNTSSDSTPPK